MDIFALSTPFRAVAFGERLAVVLVGGTLLLSSVVLVRRIFSRSFFHGFLVSTGMFLSFDIVVFHWLFGLHRITSGEEANVIEPILVALGAGFIVYGFRADRVERRASPQR